MTTNFYRDIPFDEENTKVIEMCRHRDRLGLIRNELRPVSDMTFEHENPSVRPGMRIIRHLINEQGKGLKVCDVGCALGNLIKQLHEDGHDAIGVDCSPALIMASGLPVIYAFSENLPFQADTFDCVIAQEVLEHVMDLEQSLLEMKRIMKPTGTYYFQVPYKNGADCSGHVRQFDEEKLSGILTTLGFTITRVQVIKYLDIMDLDNIFVYGGKR